MAFEPYTEDTSESPAARGLVLLTVQREGDLAGAWHEALLGAGLDAELHIRDAASFSPTSSVYPTGAAFVYVLFVAKHGPRARRQPVHRPRLGRPRHRGDGARPGRARAGGCRAPCVAPQRAARAGGEPRAGGGADLAARRLTAGAAPYT